LERVAEWFTNAPIYLGKEILSRNQTQEFRMKQVVSMVISTLYMTVKPSKPFNPILGETFEGYISASPSDVFKVFLEQTSHHPPVSNFLIESPMVKISGHYELCGASSGNSYLTKNQGHC
jgi:hypothetical protein